MLKGTGIGVERGSFESQLLSGFSPARDNREHFPENCLRLGRLETKTGGSRQRTGDGWFFLALRDGSLAHAGTIHFRHRVEVIGRRKRPASRFVHEETMIAKMIVVIAGKQREDETTP